MFETLIASLSREPSLPSDVSLLIYDKVHPLLSTLPYALYWTGKALPTSLYTLIIRVDCPASVLEKACLSPYPELRTTAAHHSSCPEHAQIASALQD